MKTVSVDEAKKRLSQLIEDVEAGEEVVIQSGESSAAVRLMLVRPLRQREFGALAGKVRLTSSFSRSCPTKS